MSLKSIVICCFLLHFMLLLGSSSSKDAGKQQTALRHQHSTCVKLDLNTRCYSCVIQYALPEGEADALTQTHPFPTAFLPITALGSLAAGWIAEDPLGHGGSREPWHH